MIIRIYFIIKKLYSKNKLSCLSDPEISKICKFWIRNWLFDLLVSKIIITKRLSLVKPEAVQFCALVTLLAAPALLNPAFHIAPSKHESNSAGQLRWGIFPCYLMTKRQNTIRVNSALSSVMNIMVTPVVKFSKVGIKLHRQILGQKATFAKEIIVFRG